MYRLYEKNKNIKINLPKRLRSEGIAGMLHTASGWLVTAASDADDSHADATAAASVNHEHHLYIVNVCGYCPSSFHALFIVPLRGLTSYLVLHTKHMKCVYTANTHTYSVDESLLLLPFLDKSSPNTEFQFCVL